jgi:signal transduction histidine kinase
MRAETRAAKESASVEALQQALQRRDRQFDTLEALGARVQRATTVDEILEGALEEILARMELSAAWVFLGEVASPEGLRLACQVGLSPAFVESVRKRGLEPCQCAEVLDTGHPMQARNTTQCPRMPELLAGLREPVAHASVPLRFEGPSRGVLNVAARPGSVFLEDELRFLATLGRQIGMAMEGVQHRDGERRLDLQAKAMMAIDKSIGGGTLDPGPLIEAVSTTARQVLDSEQVYVLLGSDPTRVTVAHASGDAAIETGQVIDLVSMGWHLAARALQRRESIQMDDRALDERVNRFEAERINVGAALIHPLIAHDHVEGVLVVCRREPGPWSPAQREIAEALAAQAAVALENARLYQEARRAYRELHDAQSRIIQSEKMAVLGTFASGLAHEVRNPLNSIALQLSLLERRTARMDPGVAARTSELVSIIREEVRRLDGLVGDFLLFARAGQVRHQATDIRALADEVVRLLAPEAAAAGVELFHEPGGGAPARPEIDAERIKQVLINLVRNGIEALSSGGRVRVVDEGGAGVAWLHVHDDGPGLPGDLEVFQLFVTSKPGGTGLGLPIAQQIVHEHGGEISAESSPGRGTTFSVRLPSIQPGRSTRETA